MNDAVAGHWLRPTAQRGQPLWLAAALQGRRLALRMAETAPEAPAALARELRFLHHHADEAEALAQEDEAAAAVPLPPLDALCDTLELDDDARTLLLLAAMPELHEGFGAAFAALHARGETRPTWGLFCRLVSNDLRREAAQALLHGGPLFTLGLLRLSGEAPLPERSLQLAPGLLAALQGQTRWPEGLSPLPADPAAPAADDWIDRDGPRQALQLLAGDTPALVMLRGTPGPTLRMRTQQLAAALEAPVFEWTGPADASPHGAGAPGRDAVQQVLQQCLLLRTHAVWLLATTPPPAVTALLQDWPAPLVLAGAVPPALAASTRACCTLEAPPLSRLAAARLWRETLPELAPHGELLAARYAVVPQTLAQLRQDLLPWLAQGRTPPLAQCVAALKARTTRHDDGAARRIVPTATWSDLVLPAPRLQALRSAVQRMQHQQQVLDDWGFGRRAVGTRGLRMLFSGLPGTGKTLAAEVVAQALHADLLVIDLAQLVSKWIGETEKNLAAAFDQAEGSGAVLFFDEADALFGKRTEVGDAHDRYANIESAYLLARLERFDGVAVLATNLRGNLDHAFLRRFELALEFAEPGPAERAAIWRAQFPPQAPLAGDLDFDQLAALHSLPGALIRNAALGAAFIAAAEGQPIARAHLERALQQEYDKTGRIGPH